MPFSATASSAWLRCSSASWVRCRASSASRRRCSASAALTVGSVARTAVCHCIGAKTTTSSRRVAIHGAAGRLTIDMTP